jgi:hypothetical protein
MLEPLSKWLRERAGGAGRKMIVHAVNARPRTYDDSITGIHGGKQTNKAIHPLYSPDFAPFDFLVVSHLKHCLRR